MAECVLLLQEAVAVPFAGLLANFREQVRKIALENKSKLIQSTCMRISTIFKESSKLIMLIIFYYAATALLQLCDDLRDNELPELGVLLEDKEGQTVVKYVGKEAALRERDNARKVSKGHSYSTECEEGRKELN